MPERVGSSEGLGPAFPKRAEDESNPLLDRPSWNLVKREATVLVPAQQAVVNAETVFEALVSLSVGDVDLPPRWQ